MKETISIVVPVYQVEEYLANAINSLLTQTYPNLEIVLIDDGSTDRSGELCDRYERKEKRIQVLHQKNKGVVAARNAGIDAATGHYLMFLDGDDSIEKDYVEKMLLEMRRWKKDIIWDTIHYRQYDKKSILSGYHTSEKDLENSEEQIFLYRYACGYEGFHNDINYGVWGKLFRKDFIQRIHHTLDERIRYEEDFSCMIRCLSETSRIQYVRIGGYHYIQRPHSAARGEMKKNEGLIMLQDTLSFLEKRGERRDVFESYVKMMYGYGLIQHGRIGDLQTDAHTLVPFCRVPQKAHVIIYGLGNIGLKIMDYLRTSENYTLVGCMDQRAEKTQYQDIPVLSLADLRDVSFDAILIAVMRKDYEQEIKGFLLQSGAVKREKIALIDQKVLIEAANRALSSYG